jgi:copper(I)-binding protein
VAERVEIHQTRLVNGRREMVLLPAGLIIPPTSTLVLEPGSSHLMLVGLRQDLVQGRTFPLTLYFSQAREVTVMARVRRKVDAAGITPFPPVVTGDLWISLASAPPAHPFAVATPAG